MASNAFATFSGVSGIGLGNGKAGRPGKRLGLEGFGDFIVSILFPVGYSGPRPAIL